MFGIEGLAGDVGEGCLVGTLTGQQYVVKAEKGLGAPLSCGELPLESWLPGSLDVE